jgi:hypothetical protein
LVLAIAVLVAGCAPPRLTTGSGVAPLFVSNGLDQTISRLDPSSGRKLGPPIPVGVAPWQIAVGPRDSMLVLPMTATSRRGSLIHISPGEHGWSNRVVTIEPGALTAMIAADGERYAAVVYGIRPEENRVRPPVSCRVALIDVGTGTVERTYNLCDRLKDGLAIQDIALGSSQHGLRIFLGIWDEYNDDGCVATKGTMLALDAETGFVEADVNLAGVPRQLVLAAAPGQQGERLYIVEMVPDRLADLANDVDFYWSTATWLLRGVDPQTLALESMHELPDAPLYLAVSPDGEHAYAVSGPAALRLDTSLLHLDLLSGLTDVRVRLPGRAMGVAVGDSRIFVADPFGTHIWSVDRRVGGTMRTIEVGKHPVSVTLGAR